MCCFSFPFLREILTDRRRHFGFTAFVVIKTVDGTDLWVFPSSGNFRTERQSNNPDRSCYMQKCANRLDLNLNER